MSELESGVTKADLLGMFRTAHNNCKLVYVAMVLFGHDEMASFYTKWSSGLSIPKPYGEKDIIALLKDRRVLRLAFEQLDRTVHRAALNELFEATKAYCEETKQSPLLTRQPWYQFWRIIRNSLSHDFRLRFNEYDKQKLPVSWSGLTLDTSMEGKILTQDDLSKSELLTFLDDVRDSIETDLA